MRIGRTDRKSALFALVLLVISIPLFAAVKNRSATQGALPVGFAEKGPAFILPEADGGALSLASLLGKGVFIYFTNLDAPSRQSDLGQIVEAYRNAAARRDAHEFVVVCAGCSTDGARRLKKEFDIPFPVVADRDLAVTRSYQLSAVPAGYILSDKGTIKATHYGAIGNLEAVYRDPFAKYLNVRLGIWRFRHGTKEEKEAFKKNLPEESQRTYFDPNDPVTARIASQVPCVCDPTKTMPHCVCDLAFMNAMFRMIQGFRSDGDFTEEQITQIVRWKAEGIIRRQKEAAKPAEAKP